MADIFVNLPGSHLPPLSGAVVVGMPNGSAMIEVSVWLRRRKDAPPLPDVHSKEVPRPIERKKFAATWGADPADIEAVVNYVKSMDPPITPMDDCGDYPDQARRLVRLHGAISSFEKAFAVKLGLARLGNQPTFFLRTGELKIPEKLQGIVLGVFGLDTRPIGRRGRTMFGVKTMTAAAALPTPLQIASLYQFPNVASASGQTIALMEFGGGYDPQDAATYFANLQVTPPTLVDVSVAGGTNNPGSAYGREVTLDIEVAGAVAPESTLAVYFAPHTEMGWIEAIASAVHDTARNPGIMSISWGAPELGTSNTLTWSPSGMAAMSDQFLDAACLGMTVLAASGDDGSNCGVNDWNPHVEYPASDPLVLACGGTEIDDFAGDPNAEIAWSLGGGGISDVYQVPSYQTGVQLPLSRKDMGTRRGVPDIAGYAYPGYEFEIAGKVVLGGTSLVAPLYAGAIARLNVKNGKLTGFCHPALYLFSGAVCRDIDDPVSNNSSNSVNWAPGYYGRTGWDARTGLGVFQP